MQHIGEDGGVMVVPQVRQYSNSELCLGLWPAGHRMLSCVGTLRGRLEGPKGCGNAAPWLSLLLCCADA